MATAIDVAAYVVKQKQPIITHMKLQKLVYYSQAWTLVWDEIPLFAEPIEAWVNGPVVPVLFTKLQGKFGVLPDHFPADAGNNLTDTETANVQKILGFYGDKSPQWLSDLSHMEKPWMDAREGLAPNERGNQEITHASMAEYYGSLV